MQECGDGYAKCVKWYAKYNSEWRNEQNEQIEQIEQTDIKYGC